MRFGSAIVAAVVSNSSAATAADDLEPQTLYTPVTSSSMLPPQVVVIGNDRSWGKSSSSSSYAMDLESRLSDLASSTNKYISQIVATVNQLSEQVDSIVSTRGSGAEFDSWSGDPANDEDWAEYFHRVADDRQPPPTETLSQAREMLKKSDDLALALSAARTIAAHDDPVTAKKLLSELGRRLKSKKAKRQIDLLISDYRL